MAWVVGMADDENPEAGASHGRRRKKPKPLKGSSSGTIVNSADIYFYFHLSNA